MAPAYSDLKRYMAIPDIITLSGLTFSIAAIFLLLRHDILLATATIYISAAFDFMDGKVARMMKRKGRFGAELDGLCDVVLYLMAMAVFGYVTGLDTAISITIYTIFMISGIMRLARFSITGTKDGCYEGMPVSYTLIIPPTYYILLHFSLDPQYLLLLYLIPSFLMLSTKRIRKF